MAGLALPEPQQLEVAQLRELAAQIVLWAESVEDVSVVSDAAAKWAAITEYVRRKSMDGVADAEAALRRLEVRIGRLLGPAKVGAHSSAIEGADLTPDARSQFRQLAEHGVLVEAVIAESTDANPPSRRKILTAIARKKDEADLAAALADGARLAPVILDAIAALPVDDGIGDWIVTLRFTATHIDDVRFALPDNAEVISIKEAQ